MLGLLKRPQISQGSGLVSTAHQQGLRQGDPTEGSASAREGPRECGVDEMSFPCVLDQQSILGSVASVDRVIF